MAKRKSPDNSSNREKKWDQVYKALVTLTQNLNQGKKILEERIKTLNKVIYEMTMHRDVEFQKFRLMLGVHERDAFVYKKGYESVDNDISNLSEGFAILSQKISEQKAELEAVNDGCRIKTLQDEIKKLKNEHEKCRSEKQFEISALLDEKKFVWNQYNKMESDLNEKFKKKCEEVECANEKVQAVVNRAEELQILNKRLKIDLAKVESEKSAEVSRLLKEIELLKSKLESETPLLRKCGAVAGPSNREGTNSTRDVRLRRMKNESDPKQTSEKNVAAKPSAHKSTGGRAPKKQLCSKEGSSRSKRKSDNIITILDDDDTPKLFTSSFKVPKLKQSSNP